MVLAVANAGQLGHDRVCDALFRRPYGGMVAAMTMPGDAGKGALGASRGCPGNETEWDHGLSVAGTVSGRIGGGSQLRGHPAGRCPHGAQEERWKGLTDED